MPSESLFVVLESGLQIINKPTIVASMHSDHKCGYIYTDRLYILLVELIAVFHRFVKLLTSVVSAFE